MESAARAVLVANAASVVPMEHVADEVIVARAVVVSVAGPIDVSGARGVRSSGS